MVAVPFVRIGGGWGELNGKKDPLGQAKILHYSILLSEHLIGGRV